MAQQHPANGPPPKSSAQVGSTCGPTPFKPPSAGNTSDVVEASGTANPGEIVSSSNKNAVVNGNPAGKPVPQRPWVQGGGIYGNNMYRGGYGGGIYGNNICRGGYGGQYGHHGVYGGGIYNGTNMGVPNGTQDPNNPDGASPPAFWISFLRVVHGAVEWFGQIALLIDQNTQALHMFLTALLQIFDRSGLLYGELARFALRLLGIKTKPAKVQPPVAGGHSLPAPAPNDTIGNQKSIEGPKAAPTGFWDKVWETDASK